MGNNEENLVSLLEYLEKFEFDNKKFSPFVVLLANNFHEVYNQLNKEDITFIYENKGISDLKVSYEKLPYYLIIFCATYSIYEKNKNLISENIIPNLMTKLIRNEEISLSKTEWILLVLYNILLKKEEEFKKVCCLFEEYFSASIEKIEEELRKKFK